MPDLKYGSTLCQVYSNAALRYDGLPGFCRKDKSGAFVPLSFRETYERGLDLATSLITLGVQSREHVGLLADNRLEWILSDYAILLAGAADVPRGTDITDAELIYILTHSDARFVFVENKAMLARVQHCRPQLPHLRGIIVMASEDIPAAEGVHRLDQLIAEGARKCCLARGSLHNHLHLGNHWHAEGGATDSCEYVFPDRKPAARPAPG
jgi:long-chain acyl-CoA synthetase